MHKMRSGLDEFRRDAFNGITRECHADSPSLKKAINESRGHIEKAFTHVLSKEKLSKMKVTVKAAT